MKTKQQRDSMYRGVVVYNEDPEVRGRVKVYVPGVYPIQFKDKYWLLPWAQPAMPVFGGCWTNQRKIESQSSFDKDLHPQASAVLSSLQPEISGKIEESAQVPLVQLPLTYRGDPVLESQIRQRIQSSIPQGMKTLQILNANLKDLNDPEKRDKIWSQIKSSYPDTCFQWLGVIQPPTEDESSSELTGTETSSSKLSQGLSKTLPEASQSAQASDSPVGSLSARYKLDTSDLSVSLVSQLLRSYQEFQKILPTLVDQIGFVMLDKFQKDVAFQRKMRPILLGQQLNSQTGWCSVPHMGKMARDGSQVWIFFQAGDVNKPIYFASAQSGSGWLSEHPRQHVFKSDNVTCRIDQQPEREESSCKFQTYNSQCFHYEAPEASTPKPEICTTVDLVVHNPRANAVNVRLFGNVNMKIIGDQYIHHIGNKYQTHHGNTYINHIGDTYIQRTGYTSQHLVSGNTKIQIDNGDLDFFRHGNAKIRVEGSQDIGISGTVDFSRVGDQHIDLSGSLSGARSGDQLIKKTGALDFTQVGDAVIDHTGKQTLTLNGDLQLTRVGDQTRASTGEVKITVNGPRQTTINGSQKKTVKLTWTQICQGVYSKTVKGLTTLTTNLVKWAATLISM